jgi:hypothetical protein
MTVRSLTQLLAAGATTTATTCFPMKNIVAPTLTTLIDLGRLQLLH